MIAAARSIGGVRIGMRPLAAAGRASLLPTPTSQSSRRPRQSGSRPSPILSTRRPSLARHAPRAQRARRRGEAPLPLRRRTPAIDPSPAAIRRRRGWQSPADRAARRRFAHGRQRADRKGRCCPVLPSRRPLEPDRARRQSSANRSALPIHAKPPVAAEHKAVPRSGAALLADDPSGIAAAFFRGIGMRLGRGRGLRCPRPLFGGWGEAVDRSLIRAHQQATVRHGQPIGLSGYRRRPHDAPIG